MFLVEQKYLEPTNNNKHNIDNTKQITTLRSVQLWLLELLMKNF